MKVSQLLEKRRAQWRELELFCAELKHGHGRRMGGAGVARFAALYRSACADLALADAYQLPPDTVQYLHQLVGRAHNQLYRSQLFRWHEWGHTMFVNVPRQLLADRTLWLAFAVFWGVFLAAMYFGYASSEFCEQVVGEATLAQLENMYSKPIARNSSNMSSFMTGFYVLHNPSIGLRCFAAGLLFGVGGLFITVSNALQLGAMFGHMVTFEHRENFFEFVTAHGPFELTAIVFSAAAGMRLGFALVDTRGQSRVGALRKAASESMATAGAAVVLFCLAALIEGFLSPSGAPYVVKAGVAVLSTLLLLGYVFGLGLLGRR